MRPTVEPASPIPPRRITRSSQSTPLKPRSLQTTSVSSSPVMKSSQVQKRRRTHTDSPVNASIGLSPLKSDTMNAIQRILMARLLGRTRLDKGIGLDEHFL